MENISDFIKKLKVLYVEDEEPARNMFGKFLNKKFESSTLCANGLDGFLKFEEALNENKPYDLIISDINMPKMDGIEFLEKIRDKGIKVPFIFTTARTEIDQMLKAINLNANEYLVKPLDFNNVEKTIEKICEDIYYKKNYELQKKESDAYISILNKEAIVSKTDIDGNITFVNDAFLEVSGFSEDEVIGKNHNIIRHPNNPDSLYKEMWETILSGKTWEGTIKNLSKDKETYYINTKIIPIFDEAGKNIVEFISVRFLVTQEENQRRAQNRKFLEQVSIYKKEIATLKKEKEDIISKVGNNQENTIYLKEKLITYEQKIKNLLSQIEIYEKRNLELSKVDLMMKQDKSKQFDMISKQLMLAKTQVKNLTKEVETLRKLVEDKDVYIKTMELKKEEYEKRIENLLDLVNNLQKENAELKAPPVEEKEEKSE